MFDSVAYNSLKSCNSLGLYCNHFNLSIEMQSDCNWQRATKSITVSFGKAVLEMYIHALNNEV